VTSFDFEGLPSLIIPKDQYSLGAQVTQTIWDGGLNAQQKNTERVNTQTEIRKNEVELYKVKERVIQLFGNILLVKENLDVLDQYIQEIESRKTKMASAVKNGTMLQSNLDILDAEQLKTQQKLIEAKANATMYYQVLSILIQQPIDEKIVFEEIPTTSALLTTSMNRPEFGLFTMQQNLIGERLKLARAKTKPRLSAFGDGAFGRPGYNFLNQKFRFYGMVGLSLTWNVSSLVNLSYEEKNLSLTRQMIDEQKSLFQLGLSTTLIQQSTEIDKLREMITIDQAIVEKRKSISKVSADQLDNGTITSTEYLTELNSEKQAQLTQRMHEIQLGLAIVTLNNTSGN
jgi:outer membrane protein TolC